MSAESSLVLASLVLFAVVAGGLAFTYRRRDQRAQRRAQIRRDAEAKASTDGAWYIHRDGAVFRAANDSELREFCRRGHIHPFDDVFVASEQRWKHAANVPLADIVFPAYFFGQRRPDPSIFGWPSVLVLFWWLSALEQLRRVLTYSFSERVSQIFVTGAILLTMYAVWRYWRERQSAAASL